LGDDVTGFMVQPGGASEAALAILTRNNTATLYGSGVVNWQLIPTNQEAGAIPYTIQRLGPTLMMDDRGLTSLQASQAYGNFQSATLSKLIHTWLRDKRTLAQASCVARDKNQYRLFFSDTSALYVTMDNGQVIGMMPMLLADEVTCIWSAEFNDGSEGIFFGSSDGQVYQMERGTSFDGDAIEAYIYLAFNHSKTPRQRKRYRKPRSRWRVRATPSLVSATSSGTRPRPSSSRESQPSRRRFLRPVGQRNHLGCWSLGRGATPASRGGHDRHGGERLDHHRQQLRHTSSR
jgi:hypothetical protein